MLHVSRGMLLAGVLAGIALLCGTRPATAQNGNGEAVRIPTVDGVTLHGMFYPSAKNKKDAPTIIFLHKFGDKGLQKSYYGLAEALQANYSVMLFDFRGHGKSKDIKPEEFWRQPFNAQNVRGAKATSTTIEHSQFTTKYLPALVNDIAAVKAYLDRKNDNGDCNTSSTILIGAESGATLGAIWLNAQWSLVRMMPNPNNPLLQPIASPNPEGKDVIACIWMSIDKSLGKGNPVSLTRTLQTPVAMQGCPTVFMYGEANTADKDLAQALVKALKKGDDKKYEFVVPYGIKGTNLRGISLAVKSLHLEKIIGGYLDTVVDKKGGEWTRRDFEKSAYMWRNGGQAKILAPGVDSKNLMFNTYDNFIGR